MLPDGAEGKRAEAVTSVMFSWHLAAAKRLSAMRANVMALTFASPALQKAPGPELRQLQAVLGQQGCCCIWSVTFACKL